MVCDRIMADHFQGESHGHSQKVAIGKTITMLRAPSPKPISLPRPIPVRERSFCMRLVRLSHRELPMQLIRHLLLRAEASMAEARQG